MGDREQGKGLYYSTGKAPKFLASGSGCESGHETGGEGDVQGGVQLCMRESVHTDNVEST